jgi:hypothetical protein
VAKIDEYVPLSVRLRHYYEIFDWFKSLATDKRLYLIYSTEKKVL